jgi:hypothetical protein
VLILIDIAVEAMLQKMEGATQCDQPTNQPTMPVFPTQR